MDVFKPQEEHKSQLGTKETHEIVTVSYEELLAFDPQQPNDILLQQVGCLAFGPNGLGIVQVSGVPKFSELRSALLPLAAQLAELPDLETTCVDPESFFSVGWSHGKEVLASSGEVDLHKGSFYANPLTPDLADALQARDGPSAARDATALQHPEFFAPNIWPSQQLPELEGAFCDMGRLLHHVGCMIAEVCDAYCLRCHGVPTGIAPTLRRSLNAKGRLLHYFPLQQESLLSSSETQNVKQQPWCAWHNDHGSLTGLVPGLFLSASSPHDNTATSTPSTEIVSSSGGLYIQARSGECVRVAIPSDHCAFQIGETSQIMSGGLLRATPHAVLPPTSNVSRESFALFLEPEFDDPLTIPLGFSVDDCQGGSLEDSGAFSLGLRPLKDRWKVGQTFGDFHLATVSAFTAT